MIKSLLLTSLFVLGSGVGAVKESAPILNNYEKTEKKIITKTTNNDTLQDTIVISPFDKENGTTDITSFRDNTTQMGQYDPNNTYRVAKITDNAQIGNTQIRVVQVAMTRINTNYNQGNYIRINTENTFIISLKQDYVPKKIELLYNENETTTFSTGFPNVHSVDDAVRMQLTIYSKGKLPNSDVMSGYGYQTKNWQDKILNGQIDATTTLDYTYDEHFIGEYEGTKEANNITIDTSEYYYKNNGGVETNNFDTTISTAPIAVPIIAKTSTNIPTEIQTHNSWNTIIFAFKAQATYNKATFNNNGYQVQERLNKWCSVVSHLTLKTWRILDPNNPNAQVNIDYEIIDTQTFFWSILTMPFTFVATAFNFTLFENTVYAINPSHILLAVLGALVLAWILKKLISRG